MPSRRKKENVIDTEQQDDERLDESIKTKLIKDVIRSCVLAGINNEVMLNYINSGLLGFQTDKEGTVKINDAGAPIPKTITLRHFYRYKAKAMSLHEIQSDFNDFVRVDYALQISSVKSMLQILTNIMFKAIMKEKEPEKQAKLAHNLFKDLPSYTQFLDISKSAIKHGHVKLEGKNETKDGLAANN